jgi:hypothetical protein
MPVDYRPSGKAGEDKVWLLVARPIIWIEEEMKELRKSGKEATPKSIWDSEVAVEEKPAPPEKRLPLDDDVKEVLQAIIKDILTNPELKPLHKFYGSPKDKTFSLVDGDKLGWPLKFTPETYGYKRVEVKPGPFRTAQLLGISLEKFDLKQKADLLNPHIRIYLFNSGSSVGSFGIQVPYVARRVGKRWTVENGGFDRP